MKSNELKAMSNEKKDFTHCSLLIAFNSLGVEQ
jgi:hypothetical protein